MVAFRAERLFLGCSLGAICILINKSIRSHLPPPLRWPQKLGANLQLTYANRANVERFIPRSRRWDTRLRVWNSCRAALTVNVKIRA